MTTTERPGCLTRLLTILGIQSQPIHQTPPIQEPPLPVQPAPEAPPSQSASYSPPPDQPLPYRRREDFLSKAELSFYHVLQTTLQGRLIICPKVTLRSILFIDTPYRSREWWHYFGRINQGELDFVICHPETMQPLLVIELDDKSHRRKQDHDEKRNAILEAAKIPLMRVPAQSSYNTRELIDELKRHLSPANTDE